ncbi:MAG: diacylglycerol kinase family lipid kinase [Gemmatimonadota bacterium]|nr:diacylglycerol kinase family lipid kinase [Gemmatimonadota bacterium]
MIHVILNPTGGSGRAQKAWTRAESHLGALSRPLTVHRTTGRGSATAIARELSSEGSEAVVVAVGGDGTVHEVTNGLLHGGQGRPAPAFAVLPVGTGNDFARGFGFSTDPGVLVRWLAAGATRRVDAGHLAWPGGEEWFVNIASFGFTGAAARHADRRSKRLGVANYAHSAVAAILAHRDYDLTLSVDGGPPVRRRLGTVVLANAPWFGSGMHVAPGARPDDGLLDLLTVEGAGRIRLLGLLAGVFTGRHLRSRTVTVRPVRTVRLEWEGDLPLEAEGELVGARSPLTATVHPGALRMVTQAASQR